jgi:hypothetical protein
MVVGVVGGLGEVAVLEVHILCACWTGRV